MGWPTSLTPHLEPIALVILTNSEAALSPKSILATRAPV
jgi:hypothetical protein